MGPVMAAARPIRTNYIRRNLQGAASRRVGGVTEGDGGGCTVAISQDTIERLPGKLSMPPQSLIQDWLQVGASFFQT